MLRHPLVPAPGEAGLERLHRDLDALQAAQEQEGWTGRLREWWPRR